MTSLPDKSNGPRRGETAREYSARLLVLLVEMPGVQITQGVAVELARHFAHLAGGDGHGLYSIVHDPTGDRIHG
jgi:hypothetical protein